MAYRGQDTFVLLENGMSKTRPLNDTDNRIEFGPPDRLEELDAAIAKALAEPAPALEAPVEGVVIGKLRSRDRCGDKATVRRTPRPGDGDSENGR